jgi:biotin transport system substrate-specific component
MQAIKLSLVYLPGDILKATLASYLVFRLRKHPVFNRSLTGMKNPADGSFSKNI